MRPVFTAADLEKIASGGEVVVTQDALITPLAREEAERRNISFRIERRTNDSTENPHGSSIQDHLEAASTTHTVAIGSDHGGYELKEQLKLYLREWNYRVLDLGTDSAAAVDYPDFAEAVALAVVERKAWRGITIDSAGIGSSIAANKVPGARAALCYDRATARNSREHNDANVLSLGARLLAPETAREILAVWLETPFAGGRHQRRVDKIIAIERRFGKS